MNGKDVSGVEPEEEKDGTGNEEAPKTHWELQGHGVTVVRDEES